MDLPTFLTYFYRIYDNPKRFLRIFFSPSTRKMLFNIFKEPSAYGFINFLNPVSQDLVTKYLTEIKNDNNFFTYLQKRHLEVREKRLPQPQGWAYLIYVLIRILKPKIVLETGVFDGLGTSFILKALHKNKQGKLISVDFPARKVIPGSTDLMPFQTLPLHEKPGWLIPPILRSKWQLQLINTTKGLRDILKKNIELDIFLHDSLHTQSHMLWEMNLVWSKLKKGGIFLIDDIFCNDAFNQFKQEKRRNSIFKYGLGAIIK